MNRRRSSRAFRTGWPRSLWQPCCEPGRCLRPGDFLKCWSAATDDQILGFTGFGVGAGETMATVQLAMRAGIPYTVLRDMTITHPTLAEGIVALFSKVPAIK